MRSDSRATVLLDANVLVYQHDPRDRERQSRADDVVQQLIRAERAAVSVQCLTEFYNTTTRRLPEPLDAKIAVEQVSRLVQTCAVLDLTSSVVLEGCRGSAAHQMSLWDALIWSAAKMNGVPYVLTEDAEHGRVLEGVTYLDPFDARFDLAPLLG